MITIQLSTASVVRLHATFSHWAINPADYNATEPKISVDDSNCTVLNRDLNLYLFLSTTSRLPRFTVGPSGNKRLYTCRRRTHKQELASTPQFIGRARLTNWRSHDAILAWLAYRFLHYHTACMEAFPEKTAFYTVDMRAFKDNTKIISCNRNV
jgi:hypothetical protein